MINKVAAISVIKNLPTITGYTDYDSLNEMIQILYANAATLPSTLSGRTHAHIDLIMKDTL